MVQSKTITCKITYLYPQPAAMYTTTVTNTLLFQIISTYYHFYVEVAAAECKYMMRNTEPPDKPPLVESGDHAQPYEPANVK
jgi:hypothetical protein